MAVKVTLKKGDVISNGYVGFSWTTFFFGFFVPLFRGDIAWFLIMLVLQILSFGLAQFILCFLYNSFYTKKLLVNGYVPYDTYSEGVLRARGYIV